MTMQIHAEEAKVGVTYGGHYSELTSPMLFDTSNEDIKTMVTEAVRSGSVPGIAADEHASFDDYVIERDRAHEGRPYNLIQVRPKTPFG